MKYITFTVPCYNSQEYMRKSIDSLLVGGEDVEIVIVNDGSKDGTIDIAREYEEKYPTIVRVVDKENGGHGSGVNAGLSLASGLYFKVVDSDDWVDRDACLKFLAAIKEHEAAQSLPDLYIVNYVYEHSADGTRYFSRYNKKFPNGTICTWDKVKPFRFSLILLMHALVYRTAVLRESGVVLPEHTFYVDDIVSYNPLPYAKKICYLNLDLYRYFIGRADQSVNLPNMVKRCDQMIRVMKIMIDRWTYDEIKAQPKGLRKYMFHALGCYLVTTLLFILGEYSKERTQKVKELWQYIKERDKKLYGKLRFRSYSAIVMLFPGRLRKAILVGSYKILCKRVKLG